MYRKRIVTLGCLLAIALVTLSCTPAPAVPSQVPQHTPTPNGPLTPSYPPVLTGPRATTSPSFPVPLKKMPPSVTQAPSVTPDLTAWPFATPICTQNPAGLTLVVTERPGRMQSPTGAGIIRSFAVEGTGFVMGESVTIYLSGYPPVAGNKGSTTETVGADGRFATTIASVISQEKMRLDLFVVHSRGVACITIEAER